MGKWLQVAIGGADIVLIDTLRCAVVEFSDSGVEGTLNIATNAVLK